MVKKVLKFHISFFKEALIANFYYKNDLPANFSLKGDIAIDTEAMGLNNHRDRLCVVQFSNGDGNAHIVHFVDGHYDCPNLIALLSQPDIEYIFHFARFDVAIIHHYLGINFTKLFCSKIASRLCRTYTDQHGLKDLCNELLGVKISKFQQSSYWGAGKLTDDQIAYAAGDVLYLHKLRTRLNEMLEKESRVEIARKCMDFLPTRAKLDLMGWNEQDIFVH